MKYFITLFALLPLLAFGGINTGGSSSTSGGVTTNMIALGSLNTNVANFVNSRSLAKFEADDIAGCVGEIQAAGYITNLVDIWPLQSRWGTNQTSLYGVPWTGWNQAISGIYTNPVITAPGGSPPYNSPYSATNPAPCVTVLPLRTSVKAFTLVVVIENPKTLDANDSRAYYHTEFSIQSTNGNSETAFTGVNQPLAAIVATEGASTIDWSYSTSASNVVFVPINGGFNTAYGELYYRTTWVISYDGNGNYSEWHNANPCASPTNGTSKLDFTYRCPLTVTNSMNQIVLGFDYMWATNGFVQGNNNRAQPFYGTVHSVMLFNRAAVSNVIVNNNMLGSSLANCGYRASRWLEKSDTDISIDGTSMMRPNYKINSIETNEIGMAYFQRHPEIPCVSDYSCNGQSISSMQSTSQSIKLGCPPYGFSYLHITQLPRGKVKKVILITDHPRNDQSIVGSGAKALFDSWYAPLRPYLTDLIQISDGNMGTNGNSTHGIMQVLTNNLMMQEDQVITKWVPEFKYVCIGGIMDINDTNLSTSAHNDGFNQAYAWDSCQQWAALIDGVPMRPFAHQSPSGVTNTTQEIGAVWPTYTVTLSGSPCFWTNLVATEAQVMFAGGIVTGISLNGSQVTSLAVAGGTTTLSPFDVIGFTNTASPPFFQYKPLAPK